MYHRSIQARYASLRQNLIDAEYVVEERVENYVERKSPKYANRKLDSTAKLNSHRARNPDREDQEDELLEEENDMEVASEGETPDAEWEDVDT